MKYAKSYIDKYFSDVKEYHSKIELLNIAYGELDRCSQPYHLLEGHLRMGYFRNIYREEKHTLRQSHPIWIVNIKV